MRKIVILLFIFFSFIHAKEDVMLRSANAYLITMQNYTGKLNLVNNAKAILIFPSIKKVGFVVGGMYGEGVALIKEQGSFKPYFVSLSNASIGFQIGYEDNYLVMFVMKDSLLKGMKNADLTLGADVTASVGNASANLGSLDVFTRSIYAFMNKSGLFAGASLGGVVVNIKQNEPYKMNGYAYENLIKVISRD